VITPLVSVIIVSWNSAKYLHACLSSLYDQVYSSIEVIILDNGSIDNSCQVIETFQSQVANVAPVERSQPYPSLKLIRNRRNEGLCRKNNQGIRESGGEFVLLLNPDVILDSQFIANLVKVMQSDQMIGIALGKLLSAYESTKIDSAGIVIRKNRRAFDRGQGENDTGQYNEIEEVFGASGAACLYRRTMLEDSKYDLGDSACEEYLDELFFMYKEDVDLSWRARLLGWKCVYTPDAVGWHYRTWGKGKRKSIPRGLRRHSLKNRYLIMLKNEGWNTIFPHFFSILGFELCSVLYILFREPYLLAVVNDMIRGWPQIMKKRKIIQKRSMERKGADNIVAWFQ
jgi:GT2 family glycosyltransferase